MREAFNQDVSNDVVLRCSPNRNAFIVEEHLPGNIISYKEISALDFYYAINNCYEVTTYLESGLLPENCISVSLSSAYQHYVLWHSELYADISYFGVEYERFPIPRLVVGVRMLETGRVVDCTLGVVTDEKPTPDTVMYHYPFSNVFDGGKVCTGNNVMPAYKKRGALKNFPRYLLGIPDNDDYFSRKHNKLGLSHGDLLEHLKDKSPAYYYTDILVPSGETLKDFIHRR